MKIIILLLSSICVLSASIRSFEVIHLVSLSESRCMSTVSYGVGLSQNSVGIPLSIPMEFYNKLTCIDFLELIKFKNGKLTDGIYSIRYNTFGGPFLQDLRRMLRTAILGKEGMYNKYESILKETISIQEIIGLLNFDKNKIQFEYASRFMEDIKLVLESSDTSEYSANYVLNDLRAKVQNEEMINFLLNLCFVLLAYAFVKVLLSSDDVVAMRFMSFALIICSIIVLILFGPFTPFGVVFACIITFLTAIYKLVSI